MSSFSENGSDFRGLGNDSESDKQYETERKKYFIVRNSAAGIRVSFPAGGFKIED